MRNRDSRNKSAAGWRVLGGLSVTIFAFYLVGAAQYADGNGGALILFAVVLFGLGCPTLGAWGSFMVAAGVGETEIGKIWGRTTLFAGVVGFVACAVAVAYFNANSAYLSEGGVRMLVAAVLISAPPLLAGAAAHAAGAVYRDDHPPDDVDPTEDAGAEAGHPFWARAAVFIAAAAVGATVLYVGNDAVTPRDSSGAPDDAIAGIHAVGADSAAAYHAYLDQFPNGAFSDRASDRLLDLDPSFAATNAGEVALYNRQQRVPETVERDLGAPP